MQKKGLALTNGTALMTAIGVLTTLEAENPALWQTWPAA
jgi:histidine ammonia-lyase